MSLLRAARWVHLAVLLEARDRATEESVRWRLNIEVRTWISASRQISRGPDAEARARIERLLHTIDPSHRREIEFVLRTST